MLFPSAPRPRHIPSSTTDSQYDTATGYSSSSYTRWPRSTIKSHRADRPTNSASRSRYQYHKEPFSDILHYPHSQKQHPMYSTISPQRSVLNNLSPISNGGPVGNGRQRTRQSNWSSLGSLNSFGESTTTPPSSQEQTGGNGSKTNGNAPQRETLHSRFDFKQTLGKGTYGKVKLALDKRKNEQVAIKTIKKSRIENPHDLARIRREIDFMTSLNHPYIIKIKEVYESREKIILVMEYASGGELYDYLNRMKRIPESQARAIFRQIVSAVHFLHKNQIVHRDLKLENILIDHSGDIKLADFGLSNSWSSRRLLHTFCGSPLYASPEIVSGIPYYGPEVDCWSLGVLLYTLVYGSMPFQGGDYNRLVRNITSGDFIKPREQSGALGLIRKCLTKLPSKRVTIDDIATHWWINLGYKHPPVHQYCSPAMKKNDMSTSLHNPALTYNGSPTKVIESNSKPFVPSTPVHSQPFTTGALSLIQYCLKPDAISRATIDDILHHDWLTHGPVLSLRLNGGTSNTVDPTHSREPSSTSKTDNSLSPNNSLVELELHTSSFFDTTRLRNKNTTASAATKEQQRRNRSSAIPISTRYLTSNDPKSNSSSRPVCRRPVSLSIDGQHSTNEPPPTQTSTFRRTTSPTKDRLHLHRYTLATSPPSTASSQPRTLHELGLAVNDLKWKTTYKYTPPSKTANLAPSVFTTSAIKFAPPPTRRVSSPPKEKETSSSTSTVRLSNNTTSNSSSHTDDTTNLTSTNNNQQQNSLLTSTYDYA